MTPTPGQLAAAFNACRLPGWPEQLDAALADPLLSRLVRLHAIRLAQGHDDWAARRTVHRPQVIAPEPPEPAPHPAEATTPPPPRRSARQRPPRPARGPSAAPTTLPLFTDRKRAAAGDSD